MKAVVSKYEYNVLMVATLILGNIANKDPENNKAVAMFVTLNDYIKDYVEENSRVKTTSCIDKGEVFGELLREYSMEKLSTESNRRKSEGLPEMTEAETQDLFKRIVDEWGKKYYVEMP